MLKISKMITKAYQRKITLLSNTESIDISVKPFIYWI